MRISILGKGGSGKTSISTAIITYLSKDFEKILAIDADLNAHLGKYIGFTKQTKPIGEDFEKIIKHILKNRNIKSYPKIGTIPPNKDSNFIKIDNKDEIIKEYTQNKKNIFHMSVGTYTEKDLGDVCFHAKLNSLEIIMHHMLDKESELVVIDGAAGVDNVATSVFFIPDITFYIIEPTEKSISVYLDYITILKDKIEKYKIKIIPIINKYENKEDIDYIKTKISIPKNLIKFKNDYSLIKFEQSKRKEMEKFINNHKKELEKIKKEIKGIKRDEKVYLEALKDTFRKECETWANKTFTGDFTYLAENNFSYKELKNV